jgi:hypothetical protein
MEIPRHWRLKAQRYRLAGSTCPICGTVSFPPRPVCGKCTSKPVRIINGGLSTLSKSIDITNIESHIGYRFIERVLG